MKSPIVLLDSTFSINLASGANNVSPPCTNPKDPYCEQPFL